MAKRRKRKPRVLVVVSAHQSKAYSIEDVLINLARQKYKEYEVRVLVNNSDQDFSDYCLRILMKVNRRHYLRKRKRPRIFMQDIGKIPGKYKGDIQAKVINRGIDHALKGAYDYLLVVGADLVLPDKGIKILLEAFNKFDDCGVSCLTCYFRSDIGPTLEKVLESLDIDQQQVDGKVPMVLMPKDSPDMGTKQYYAQPWLKALAGDGAMMFPRKVFQGVRWRASLEEMKVGSDFQFCIDVREKLGLSTYIYTKVFSPHLYQDSEGAVGYV